MTALDVIRAEAAALSSLADIHQDIEDAADFLEPCWYVVCTGLGKSGYIARKVSASLASLGTHSYFVHPTEALHGDYGRLAEDCGVLAFSRSGQAEGLSLLNGQWPSVLVTMATNDKLADRHITLPALDEAWGAAPTVSSTMMICAGDALAVALAERRGFTPDDFKALHPGGAIGSHGPQNLR